MKFERKVHFRDSFHKIRKIISFHLRHIALPIRHIWSHYCQITQENDM
jgi:hypothetical protein